MVLKTKFLNWLIPRLLVIRQLMFRFVEGRNSKSGLKKYLWKSYWLFFWWIEKKLEFLELGEETSQIAGSERAVLIETLLSDDGGLKFLEVGVGYGQNLSILCSILPEKNIAGVDLNLERVLLTKQFLIENGFPNVELEMADVTDLQYEDKSFDVVFSSAMFLYLEEADAKKGLSEMLRVARKKVVLLEQHREVEGDLIKDGGVTGSRYFLRDYNKLIESVNPSMKKEEIRIPNPRWGVEEWKNAARVFVIYCD